MDVGITDARNETWNRPLEVKVSGGYLFMVGIADSPSARMISPESQRTVGG